jgi:FKBP-type peptidyl-prolyl cis-trans isomerase FklB
MMTKSILSFAATMLIVWSATAQQMKNELDSASYSMGMLVARNLQDQGLMKINADLFQKAVSDILNQRETLLTQSEAIAYFTQFQEKKKSMVGVDIRIAGEQFLAENAKRDEVVVLDNGLQYEVLVKGDGPKPAITDKVLTHYHGMLIDGTVFDSSVDRGEPIEFPLNRVIRGWTEILQLMPVGSKWRVYIPYDLAYGEHGAGGQIAPYSALIFEIELIEIR